MPDTHLIFFPPTRNRADAIAAGFRFGHIGTHTSRTIMLEELAATFAAIPVTSRPPAYTEAIVEDSSRRLFTRGFAENAKAR